MKTLTLLSSFALVVTPTIAQLSGQATTTVSTYSMPSSPSLIHSRDTGMGTKELAAAVPTAAARLDGRYVNYLDCHDIR